MGVCRHLLKTPCLHPAFLRVMTEGELVPGLASGAAVASDPDTDTLQAEE